ncbi:hypothetical protein GCM10023187_23130 [Nibrella viscosa]|uniref:Carbohydrate kinase PfkB domain-containing protein n=1 Tax=Nibrella viscosa TaxID=1084524 RepID=A0ABP8KET3_9BACT
MTASELSTLFNQFSSLRAGVIGDFAVDLYFDLQKITGEISLETTKEVYWGRSPQSSPGGAGNVVANLAALGVTNITVFGCTGNDLYGREMRYLLQAAGADTRFMLSAATNWDTCTYIKPMAGLDEQNRIDFGTHNSLAADDFDQLLATLAGHLPHLDVLIINQQFLHPLLTPDRISRLNTVIARHPHCRFVADLRHCGNTIRGATLKVNTRELADLLSVPHPETPDTPWCREHGSLLSRHTGGPVVITRGERGIAYINDRLMELVDGIRLSGELDTVGAGDTVVATYAACLGVGAQPPQAIETANLAAAVTVQKLRQTGTATLNEVLSLLSAD